MKLGTMVNSGIQHISNNLDYSGTVLLAHYKDGSVIGVDYHTGLQVCSTLQPVRSFLAYAMNTIASIGSGGWALPVSDGSFYDGENFRDQLPDGGTEAEGGTEVNGSDAVGGDTAVSGDGADGQVSGATAPGGQAAQSGGPTAQAGTDGAASSGSGTAAAAPSSGSNDSSDGAAAEQTVEEAMKELFGSSLVAYSDSTGQYEVLDTASLAHRASRSGRQTSSPIETALTAVRITASPWHGASTAVSIRRSGRALS